MDRRKKPPHEAENGDVAARDAIMSSSSSPALALRKKAKKRLSSGSAAQRDESEFVSVEVGMREFQRRLASSKSKSKSTTADDRKKAAATTVTASSKPSTPKSTSRSSSDHLRDNAGSAQVLPPAEDQPKKRARTTKAAVTAQTTITATTARQPTASAAATSMATTPRARKTTTAAAAAAVTSSSTAPPSASSTSAPVKAPTRKRAATPAKSTPDAKSPISIKMKPRAAATTIAAATRKPRAPPVARRQTTIAEIRAQLLREQQERVESRIQTLHCANCNSVTHADGHVHAAQAPPVSVNVALAAVSAQAPAPAPGFISDYFQQQQQQQPQVVPSSPPPPMFQAQPIAYSQAPASSSINSTVYMESPLTLAVPQAAAITTQSVVPSLPSVSIKNEFIEDDFDEDMAFMLALDQVEQSLISTPTKAPAPFPPSMMYQQYHFVPVPQLFQQQQQGQQQQQQQQATVIKQIESEIDGAGHHHQPTVGTHGGSSQYAPDVKPSHEDLSQMQTPAMSADVQREFERLKRENELLRQSNELLQAAAASSSGSAVATAITTMAPSPAFFPSTVPSQIHRPTPVVRATKETKPSPSSSHSASSSDHVSAANKIRCRPQMRATNPPQAVQTPQDQPLEKRFLNLGAAGAAGTTKQEETMVDANDFSREGTHISKPASVNASERNTMQNLETGDRSQATYESTIPHGGEQRGDNLHSVPHHPGVLSDATASSGSPTPENRSVQNERNQTSSADAQDVYQPDDSQSTAEVCEEGSERHREIEYRTLEGNDSGASGEQSHAGDEDLHGDGIGGSQSADEDNEENDLTQNGDLNAADEEEEEEYEASQQEVARASTIDRGNYQQYKAQEEDEDDGDFTMEDVEMDVNMDANETSRANEDDKPSDEHVDDADLPTLSSLSSRIGQKSVSTNLGVEANHLSGRSIDNSTALDNEINRSSTELSTTAAPSNTDDHRSEGMSEESTKREETPRVTEVDITMQEAEDETIPYGKSKSEIAVMKVDDEFNEVSAEEPTPKARLRVQEVSSSDSETESDDDDNNDNDDGNGADGGIANGLEAALKAAAGGSGASTIASRSSSAANSKSQQRGSFSLGATGSVSDQPKLSRESTSNNKSSSQAKKKRPRASDERSTGDIITSAPEKKIARSKHQLGSGMSSGNSNNSSVKRTLLWPALDDFYEFVLDLSPRRIEVPEKHESNLRRYFRGTLPAKYSSLNEYTSVQIEAIMEELAASVRSSEQFSHQNTSKSLFLTSVSPCGRGFNGGQQSSSLLPSGQQLNSSTIFMESGFSGTTSGSNDFILTFHANAPGRGGSSSSDFSSGDLVLLRSPRWKQYEMVVYGVVLCNSVVAIGGSSGSGTGVGGGGRGGRDQDNDLICVLIRTQERDHANPKENFSVLTEMCLANQRSTQWKWRLEQVHNLTTSAREFQAMKSVNFFSPSIKRSLLDGKMSASESQKEKTGNGKAPATSGTSAAAGEPKSRLTPALHRELEKKYNSSQLDAILGCIGEENHVIIQGPPGTGKTKTILGVLSALLDGAAVGGGKRSKESVRIRVGASLKDGNASSGPRTVAESSIRILVAAPSNAAVDELIVRLLSEGVYDGVKCCSYRPRIVRVGRPESLQQQREPSESLKGGSERLKTDSKKIKKKKWRKYAQEVEEILLENLVTKHKSSFPNAKMARQGIVKNAQIVFCTLSGAGSVAMCDFAHEFDALVIDEAAQAVEASALIPFKFRPNRVILVGDHRQLPATVISKRLIDIGYDRSLFQRFVENGSQVFLLNRQYRMHPDISEFPSRYFYKGKLVQDAKMSDWTARKYHADRLFKPFVFYDVLSGQQSQVSGSKSLRNLTEVEFILLLVRRLLKKYPEIDWKKKIGIIAPYKQQIYELGSHLSRLEKDVDQRLDIEVNTVDGFQGREKEIIIYSCVRTSGGGGNRRKNNSQGKLDAFWADERRMNVAITRAKSSLWIVGNSQLLEQSRAWRALIRTAKDRDKYMRNTDVEL